MKIGVYVGSFNPPHIGHIKIVEYLLKTTLDKIIIIPTGNYWDKQDLINIKDRINMLKYFETENVIVNDKLNNKVYTYEIFEELNKVYPHDDLYLIIGADNIPKFHLWKNVDAILKNKIIVLNRNNIKLDEYINNFKEKGNFIIMSSLKTINISSTEIRNNIEKNKKYLDNKVYKYIKRNNLY